MATFVIRFNKEMSIRHRILFQTNLVVSLELFSRMGRSGAAFLEFLICAEDKAFGWTPINFAAHKGASHFVKLLAETWTVRIGLEELSTRKASFRLGELSIIHPYFYNFM